MAMTSLPELFRSFAQGAARDGCATYDAICRGVAADTVVLGLMAEAPPTQRRPNLILAAVHALLLAGAPHPLAAHYDTVTPRPAGPDATDPARPSRPVPDEGALVADFRDFCQTHHTELVDLMATRNTQTNEVGRCSALLPAFSYIATQHAPDQPLALLDLGTSAGLNLLFDHYGYTYRQRADGAIRLAGPADARVTLECSVRGALNDLPPLAAAPIVSRTGLDLSPIDPTTEDGAQWLLACQWPDNPPRFARLRGALAAAQTTSHHPTVHQGDIVEDLPAVAAGIPGDSPLVIFHSWVAAYLTPQRQGELVQAIRAVGRERVVHHLYAEAPVETPGLPTPPSRSTRPNAGLATALVLWPAGAAAPIRLADMHHHGNWLSWWADGYRSGSK
jgi:hypothetical protein